MFEVIIGLLILLMGFMAWGWSQAVKKQQEVEDKYTKLSGKVSGVTVAMEDIMYSKRELDAKLNAYYRLTERMGGIYNNG